MLVQTQVFKMRHVMKRVRNVVLKYLCMCRCKYMSNTVATIFSVWQHNIGITLLVLMSYNILLLEPRCIKHK